MADEAATASSIGATILSKIMFGGIIFVLILIVIGIIVGIALYIRYTRKFNVDVEIKSSRSSGIERLTTTKLIQDKGGMIYNKKSKSWWFRLRNEKVDLPPPPYEVFQQGTGGKNVIKIWQKSHDEYYYMLPDKIDVTVIIRDGRVVPIAEQSIKVVEGDVSYWNQLRKREDKKLFDPESIMMKLLPYIGLMLMFMAIIFLSYMITQHWGEFSAAAESLNKAAQALKSASGVTTVT